MAVCPVFTVPTVLVQPQNLGRQGELRLAPPRHGPQEGRPGRRLGQQSPWERGREGPGGLGPTLGVKCRRASPVSAPTAMPRKVWMT